MKSGKKEAEEGIELQNQENIKTFWEKNTSCKQSKMK